MACNFEKILLSCLLCCIFAALLTFTAYAQDSTSRSDLNINFLNVFKEDTSAKFVIAYKLQPAMGGAAKDYKDSLQRAKSQISKTINYLNAGNSDKALVSIYEAIGYCPPKEIKTLAIANSYYGLVQIRIGNYSKAVAALNKCDTLFHKLGDMNLLAFHFNNLGLFYQKFENNKSAVAWFNKSLSLSRSLGNEESIAINLNNLAHGKGGEKEKIIYLQEAVKINSKLNKIIALASNYNNLAFHYISMGNKVEALRYLNMSLAIANSYDSYDLLHQNYQLQSDLYASQGLYEKAYNALSIMKKMESEHIENTVDIEQMIQTRAISKKEYDLKIKAKEYDIKRLNNSLVIAISLIIIILVISLYIYFYINNRRKLQFVESKHRIAEKEAEYAQTELVNVASYLNTRNEILDNIQSSLAKAFKLPEKEMYTEIRKINMYIRNLQTKNEEIDSVLTKITRINEGFITALTERHPELTKNDKYIALLLRANLSTKQISVLMDCSPKSVNMARYRMRLHLNLSSETNLVNYLKSL